MSLIIPKPRPLYAPMLATFGGGSIQGFKASGGAAPPVGGAIVTTGLVGYFDAGDASTHSGSNSTWNSKTGGYSASLSNVTYNSANSGYFSWSLSSGSTAITDIQRNNNDFTYMAWARINANSNRGDEHLLDTFETSSSEWTALIINSSNSSSPKPQFVVDNNSSKTSLTGTTTIADNTWYHLAGTYHAATGQMRLLLNGSLEATATASSGQISGLTPLGIGSTRAYNPPNGRFTGDISIVMTYDEQKSDANVLQNFNAHKGRYGL